MRVELYRRDRPDEVVAVATWSTTRVELDVRDPSVPGLERLLRPTPVVVEDPSLRPLGAHGEAVLHPGSYEWFRWAVLTRGTEIGLGVRFVRERVSGGWDPAAAYRTFEEQVDRLASP